MRFRFTIRDLLWLTALMALATGWLIDHQRIRHEFLEAQLIRDIRAFMWSGK